jgi:hypothetical protein
MARDRGDAFSYTELALAARISKSAFQFLDGAGFLPRDRSIGDFKRLGAIGGFTAAGLPMVTSASIAKTIATMELNQKDGEAPSGLEDMFIRNIGRVRNIRGHNDYWYHTALYQLGRTGDHTRRFDTVLEIIERRYVFLRSGQIEVNRIEEPELMAERYKLREQRADLGKRVRALADAGQPPTEEMFAEGTNLQRQLDRTYPSIMKVGNSLLGEDEEATLVGWLEGWQRGFEPNLVHVTNKIIFDRRDTASMALYRQLNTEAQQARNNAVGTLTVNISLAIRRAFDRLAEHRAQRPAPRRKASGAA